MAAIADFVHKFGLVLKACNLSRGRLAQTVGVDKSVVSRWASGVQAPTDHNLTLLTEAVTRHRPGFARPDWDLDQQAFAEAITDDLTHDLSRIPGTMVIAQGTASTLTGRSIDARAAAREFAVR